MRKYFTSNKFKYDAPYYRNKKITCNNKYEKEEKEIIIDQFLQIINEHLHEFFEKITEEEKVLK